MILSRDKAIRSDSSSTIEYLEKGPCVFNENFKVSNNSETYLWTKLHRMVVYKIACLWSKIQ